MIRDFNYLIWLSLFVFVPTVALWLKFHQLLRNYPRTLLLVVVGATVVSVPWDLVAVQTRVWRFPKGCCIGPRVLSLPIEEYLFIIFVSVYIATATLVLRHYVSRRLARSR
jgi:lycopene cyclase domain-containing protein